MQFHRIYVVQNKINYTSLSKRKMWLGNMLEVTDTLWIFILLKLVNVKFMLF